MDKIYPLNKELRMTLSKDEFNICHLTILNFINQPILTISSNEISFINFIVSLNEYNSNLYSYSMVPIGGVYTFPMNQYFETISISYQIEESKYNHPMDDDEYPNKILFNILSNDINRLQFYLDVYELEDFLLTIWNEFLEDIENIDQLTNASYIYWLKDHIHPD